MTHIRNTSRLHCGTALTSLVGLLIVLSPLVAQAQTVCAVNVNFNNCGINVASNDSGAWDSGVIVHDAANITTNGMAKGMIVIMLWAS